MKMIYWSIDEIPEFLELPEQERKKWRLMIINVLFSNIRIWISAILWAMVYPLCLLYMEYIIQFVLPEKRTEIRLLLNIPSLIIVSSAFFILWQIYASEIRRYLIKKKEKGSVNI